MKCPTCDITLMLTERQGVEIDYCPQCRGIWLDRGELDKIIQQSNLYLADQRKGWKNEDDDRRREHSGHHQPHYDNRHRDSHHHPHKKKSFFEDIFDFD